MIPDHIEALVAFLKLDADVASVAASRVFGAELPESETSFMPRSAVVLLPAGGLTAIGDGVQRYGDVRVDVRAYGTTPKLANDVWRAVHPALKDLLREVHAETLLHWAKPSGGPISLRDPDTHWPFVLSSWQVFRSEVAVV
jgi:hypothetical protein